MEINTLPSRHDVPAPKIIAWELTRSCNLSCAHCRASANNVSYPNELTTAECLSLVDQIKAIGNPILILTGGEPLLRPDLCDIGGYATKQGLRVVVGTNGTLVTPDEARRLASMSTSRISVSLDFPTPAEQDAFRGAPGAFQDAIAGVKNARAAGLEVQINSTITKNNVKHLPALVELAIELEAVAFHPFLLVPTGRGKALAEAELSPADYEATLKWICQEQGKLGDRLMLKPTDAPHYYRIAHQNGMSISPGHGAHGLNTVTRGCLAGIGFCFISHVGRVQGCGYLDLEAGNVRQDSFANIWRGSPLFNDLRDFSLLKGKCGACEYKWLCGGCRARAYENTGDHLAAEPYCIYKPKSAKISGQEV